MAGISAYTSRLGDSYDMENYDLILQLNTFIAVWMTIRYSGSVYDNALVNNPHEVHTMFIWQPAAVGQALPNRGARPGESGAPVLHSGFPDFVRD
jgi:hypothetical protein